MVVLAFNSSTQKTNVENCLELDRKSVFKKKKSKIQCGKWCEGEKKIE